MLRVARALAGGVCAVVGVDVSAIALVALEGVCFVRELEKDEFGASPPSLGTFLGGDIGPSRPGDFPVSSDSRDALRAADARGVRFERPVARESPCSSVGVDTPLFVAPVDFGGVAFAATPLFATGGVDILARAGVVADVEVAAVDLVTFAAPAVGTVELILS